MKVLHSVILNLFLITQNYASVQEFVAGNNIFTADFYNEVAKSNKENILVSPLSTEIVFGLAQSGAKGATAEEIRTGLHLPKTTEDTELAVKTLLPTLKGDEESYSLHTANKIYVKKDFQIKNGYTKLATENYYSEVENIDFTQKEAANRINKWVEEHTNSKIHDVINQDDLDDRTAAILLNTLYLKADWEQPFSNYSTRTQNFYKTPEDSIEVEMMHADERTLYYSEDEELDASFLELPFKQHNLSMVIVLPNQKNGISTLESQISKVFAEREFHNQLLELQIPKFRIENKIDLKEILSNLGVKKAFDKKEADFSGIAVEKLWIDSAKQKTFMEVNEIGIEAAAASFIELIYESAQIERPKKFIADHPFIFYVRFGKTILFAGRVSDPTQ